jgi:hypothetical protein
MHRTALCLSIGLAAASCALAQTPPIKPGLWEVRTDRTVGGQKMPDMSERLQGMPAEQRKRMEAMMKQRGVDTSSGALRICMTRETLDQGHWQDGGAANCKTDVISRSGSTWKWHSVCTQPAVTSDGESVFHDQENYTVSIRSTVTMQGQPRESTMVSKAHRLGADCGDVKPIAPRQR